MMHFSLNYENFDSLGLNKIKIQQQYFDVTI